MYIVMSVSAFISVREYSGEMLLWRTLAITGVLAGMVGFFQFLGYSPLDISATHHARVTGTNGNPIFFGAMLVLLAPITLGVLLAGHQAGSRDSKRWWLAAIGLVSFLMAISLVATVSRGPWVGALVGGVTASALVIMFGRSKANLVRLVVLLALTIVGVLVATFIDPTPEETAPPASSELTEPTESRTNTLEVTSAFSNVGRTNTMDLRLRYWRLSRDITLDRDPVPYTNDSPTIVRWLFGYGPDMFRFAGTYFSDTTTFSRRLTAAHNDPINRLVEQGFLGFAAWLSLWATLAYGAISMIRRFGSSHNSPLHWISIAIATALAGRFVEQLFGSPTPGGVLIFWVMVGGLGGLLLKTDPGHNRIPNRIKTPRVPIFITYASLVIIAIGTVVITWDKGVNYLLANQMVSFLNRPASVTADEAVKRLTQAANLAPDVPQYWHYLADIELGRAEATQNPISKVEALSRAYEYDRKGYEANPMEVSSIYRLAFSAWEAGNAGRPELRQEAANLYERLTLIIPSDQLAKERLETLHNVLRE